MMARPDETASTHPRRPHPHSVSVTPDNICPTCPANPETPVNNFLLTTIPPPTPVETVIKTISQISFGKTVYSAHAAAWASFITLPFKPVISSIIFFRGYSFSPPRLSGFRAVNTPLLIIPVDATANRSAVPLDVKPLSFRQDIFHEVLISVFSAKMNRHQISTPLKFSFLLYQQPVLSFIFTYITILQLFRLFSFFCFCHVLRTVALQVLIIHPDSFPLPEKKDFCIQEYL